MIIITAPTGNIGGQVLDDVLASGEAFALSHATPPAYQPRPVTASRSSKDRTATSTSSTRRLPALTPCFGLFHRIPEQ